MKATVFGASGFIGGELVGHLRRLGWQVDAVPRDDESWRERELGHAFYCIGLTADFRKRPFDTIDAHVSVLTRVLRHGRFDSLLYLSSTRVYARAADADEATPIPALSSDPSDLYNLSKLLGESACLSAQRPGVRVARLSNVFGADFSSENFLNSVLRDAVTRKRVVLATSLQSEKDYVHVDDVVRVLEVIARSGSEPIYNVACGRNTTHREIADALQAATGCEISVADGAPTTRFPIIRTERLRRLELPAFAELGSKIDELVQLYSKR
jgi:nucleoside-diphosphate-sugar epimerase